MPTANEVFRDFVVDGEAASGKHNIVKGDVRTWGTGLEDGIEALEEKNEEQDTVIAAHQVLLEGMIQAVIEAQYRVGDLYFTSNPTMPPAYLVGRTWELYGGGRAVVGVGSADGVTYTGGQQRGSNTHTLTESEMPGHNHSASGLTVSIGNGGNDWAAEWRSLGGASLIGDTSGLTVEDGDGVLNIDTNFGASKDRERLEYDGTHAHSGSVGGTTGNRGGGGAHNNIQPSIGVYVFRRTA